MRAVGNLACTHENQHALLEQGAATRLIAMLSGSDDKDGCKQRVVRALANLAADNEESQVAIIREGAMEPLIQLLSGQECGFQDETKRALMLLACGADSKVRCLSSPFEVSCVVWREYSKGKGGSQRLRTLESSTVPNANSKMERSGSVVNCVELAVLGPVRGEPALTLFCVLHASQLRVPVTDLQGARAKVVAGILGVRLSSPSTSFAKMHFLQDIGDNEGVPRQLLCPITHELMEEPVIAEDGHTYEKAAIVEWFRNRNSSPMTNERLKSTQVIPNVLVHAIISDFKESREDNPT